MLTSGSPLVMPLYLVKLINNTLNNFRFAELDACLEFLRVEPRQAYDRCVCA